MATFILKDEIWRDEYGREFYIQKYWNKNNGRVAWRYGIIGTDGQYRDISSLLFNRPKPSRLKNILYSKQVTKVYSNEAKPKGYSLSI